MTDRVIDNPIINSPYRPPSRHFAFDDAGITSHIEEFRRRSEYFVPVPRPRKKLQLELQLTAADIRPNQQVNEIRERVELWRRKRYPNVTPTTRRLLEYWSNPERDNPVLFCQREAAETAIFLAESAVKSGDVWIRNAIDVQNTDHNDGLPRVALKMATGSGKTVVMAMLIAWQTLNKVAAPTDNRFAKRFLVVSPGITIRDRLRVLLPEDPQNYYRERDLVPSDLKGALGQAKIVITNFHTFQLRDTKEGKGLHRTTKELLAGGTIGANPFQETPAQMVNRVCRELGGSAGIVVLNDEAHHCYRGRIEDPEEGAETEAKLTGEDKAEAKDRNQEARVWFTGLRAIQAKLGIKTVFDLSATPFFLAGSGYREGTLFPWAVSDFSLIDAIESGIVKIPRVPVDDDRVSSTVTYSHLWPEIAADLPKKGRGRTEFGADNLPSKLEGALRSLYGSYEKQFQAWAESEAGQRGDPPPVFIVVCSNTTVSKAVFDWIAGREKILGDGTTICLPGKLELFSNVLDERWIPRPPTILVDSHQLESGQSLTADFRKTAAHEIETFKDEYRQRFPGRSIDNVTDEDILREVMNTVGKRGKLGEHVRCVVSVSMLTEGWDANTVTHILGVRAFGTQLLCEQVVGRGLRRRSYAVDENGMFTPEYADVYGVPFQFIPTVAKTRDLNLKPVHRVAAQPDRAHLAITFPVLDGYRVELPDQRLFAQFDEQDRMTLAKHDLPMQTQVSGIVGLPDMHDLEQLRRVRPQTIAFQLARVVLERHVATREDPKPWYFPQLVEIAREWLHQCVVLHDDTFPGLLLISEYAEAAANRIYRAVAYQEGDRHRRIQPVFRSFDHVGSTTAVDFSTTKEVYEADSESCHVNYVVLDGPSGNTWERAVAQALETLPSVSAYVKNDHLGFTIPYTHNGRSRKYLPDFLARLRDPGDGVARTLIVEVSGGHKPPEQTQEKAQTSREMWVPAVNNYGGFGRWSYCEITDPTKAKLDLTGAIAALYQGIGLSAAG
ncbi:MAG: BPTD_3080 family restriction endonuclease [Pseudonocardia sp.]